MWLRTERYKQATFLVLIIKRYVIEKLVIKFDYQSLFLQSAGSIFAT